MIMIHLIVVSVLYCIYVLCCTVSKDMVPNVSAVFSRMFHLGMQPDMGVICSLFYSFTLEICLASSNYVVMLPRVDN